MLIQILKLLFSASAMITSIYSINIFGPGIWSFLFLGIAITVLLSIFVEKLNSISVLIARVSGVLSLIALILLLVAATVGGTFRMSESNQMFGFMLFLLSIFGLSSFLWPGINHVNT